MRPNSVGHLMPILWVGLLMGFTIPVANAETLSTGTTISVRTNERLDVNKSDGRVFGGVVDRDVRDANGRVVIPRGSNTELIVKRVSARDLVVDLESVTVDGQRYAVSADTAATTGGQRDGIGKNQRTAKYIGGGALLGTLIGAIAGGGKGAAIGAAAGAGGGAGVQALTRGKTVRIPAESILTFRLDRPLEMGVADTGFSRRGRHYHRESR